MSALLDYPPPFVEPAYLWVPPGRRGTYGPQIVDWSAGIGHPVDAEQAAAIDALASFGPGGLWHALEVAIIEGRQNGKTDRTLLPITMFEFFILTDVFGADKITWTAHLMKTCRGAFDTVKRLIEANPELSARVADINDSSSEEAIEHVNGSVFEFAARTPGGGRGEGGKTWVGDEALILPEKVMDARLPTLSARLNPQVRYASSAGKADSEHLAKLVRRGRSMSDPSLIYVEYCAPGSWDEPGCESPDCPHTYGVSGCVLDREELWHLGNHAAGRRIGYHFLRNERRTLTPRGFARERYGWHEQADAAGTPPVSVAGWRKQLDPSSAITVDAPIVISVEIPLSRKSTAIGVAGWRDDGMAHVGLVDYLTGVDRALARILELAGKHTLHKIRRGPEPRSGKPDTRKLHPAIIIDPTSPAGMLVDPLRKAGFDPVLMAAAEVGASCAGLQDALTERTVWHRGSALVDVAIEGAVRRDLGDGNWAFGRRKSAGAGVDVAPVVALVQARWGLTVAKKTYNLLDSFF